MNLSRRTFPLLFVLLGFLLPLFGCPQRTSSPEKTTPPTATVAPLFRDVAPSAGIDYLATISGSRPLNILQTIGNGCAFLDYDRDGNLDILLVGTKVALYKGDGKGHFTDVSVATGVAKLSGHFLGCAVGDIDNDGFPDVYLSGYRTGVLLKNRAGHTFDDITASSGIKPQPWGTSCAFLETVPGSRRLDLFICNYCDFDPKTSVQLCDERGVMTSCGPRTYTPLKAALYKNLGNDRFKDISAESGVTTVNGRGLGVAVIDEKGDGHLSLAIANDEMPGDLLRSIGTGTTVRYQNEGTTSGVSVDHDGNIHGGMGIDWGDYDNDGKFDLFVATFQSEFKSLYRNEGEGTYRDFALPAGLGEASRLYVTFGAKFFDYDNDGRLDLAWANGHVKDNIQKAYPNVTYREKSLLFHNKGGSPVTFEEETDAAGPDFSRPVVGRGLAVGDFDNDGKLDLLITDSEGHPLLLHNEVKEAGHWIGFQLEGVTDNRDGYGARVTILTSLGQQIRFSGTDGSYLSASDPRVHFGLGTATKIDRLTVRWRDGLVQTFTNLTADRYYHLKQGEAPK